jgi:membrane-bound lytic murein transglycosylase B
MRLRRPGIVVALVLLVAAMPSALGAQEGGGNDLYLVLDGARLRIEQLEPALVELEFEAIGLNQQLIDLTAQVEAGRGTVAAATQARTEAEAALAERTDEHDETVQREHLLLVEAYINGRPLGGDLDVSNYDLDGANARTLARTVGDRFFADTDEAAAQVAAARDELAHRTEEVGEAEKALAFVEGVWFTTATALTDLTGRIEQTEAEVEAARAEIAEVEAAIDAYFAEVEAQLRRELAAQFAPPPEEPRYGRPSSPRPTLPNGPVPPFGIPAVMLSAYETAADKLAQSNPACDARWWALAAIGAVESLHGAIFGSAIDETGRLVDPVIGIALTGRSGTARIPDTDDGLYDGDRQWDRAVGPMQFIPSTWRSAGLDGNGDGLIDPQNVYDATLSAAAYLCRGAGGQSLSTPSGLARAAFSYNHSNAYVSKVLDYAYRYSDGEIGAGRPRPDGLPAFPTTTVPPTTAPSPSTTRIPDPDQP